MYRYFVLALPFCTGTVSTGWILQVLDSYQDSVMTAGINVQADRALMRMRVYAAKVCTINLEQPRRINGLVVGSE